MPSFTAAQTGNSNVVIEEAKEEYFFAHVKGSDGDVKVEQRSSTTYRSKDYGTSIKIQEVYNDEISIDKVSVFSDGELNKEIKPVFEYQGDEDIFYSDRRSCLFTLPLQRKGSTGEVVFNKTISNPIYFSSFWLTNIYETKKKTVRVLVPDWMSVDFKEMNFEGWNIEHTQEQLKDGIVHTFTIHDAPPIKYELHAPGMSYYAPHVLIQAKESRWNGTVNTYFKTLSDQYGWYRKLIDSIGYNDGPVKQKALEIVAGKSSDEEKVKAIYYWVQQNIRYIAYEDGIAGYKPKKAQEVLSKKYGDCKGMGSLLVVMLRALGFDARICWLGTNHLAYDHSSLSLCADNHVIAAWMRNGKPVFLDGTEKYIRFGETAERIQGRQILIENGSNYLLENVPAMHHAQNMAVEERMLHIEGSDLVGHVTHTYGGESREQLIALLYAVNLDKRTEILGRYLSADDDRYHISNLSVSDINDYNSDLKVSYDVVQKGAVTKFGLDGYVDADNRKQFVSYKLDTSKRQLPAVFPFKDYYVLDMHIALPAGTGIKSLPNAVAITNADYGYSGNWTLKGGELSYHSESWMEKTFFPLSQLALLDKDVQSVQTFYDAQPELKY